MKPLDRAGLSVGELVGYRIWEVHLVDNVQTLRSWVYPCFWLPGQVIADITHPVIGHDHLTELELRQARESTRIDDYNERGVWAFKTPELLESEFGRYALTMMPVVYGSCFMWGTVIEHSLGYRAQYARPRSLEFVTQPESSDLDFLRKRYGV